MSASGNVAGSAADRRPDPARTDSRDGVSSAPAWRPAAWVSFEVRNWMSCHGGTLVLRGVVHPGAERLDERAVVGVDRLAGQRPEGGLLGDARLLRVEDLGDRARVVVPHRDPALLEVLEAVRDQVGRDALGRGVLSDVAVPDVAELARVGLLRQEEVPVLVEVVAGDVVVVGVEPLPELERVVQVLGLVAADAEARVVVGGQLLGVVEQLGRGSGRRRDARPPRTSGCCSRAGRRRCARRCSSLAAVLAGRLDRRGDVGEVLLRRRSGPGR